MALDPSIQRIVLQMRSFKEKLYAILRRNVVRAPLAFVAKTLSGRTSTQVMDDLKDIVNTHINKKAVNVHRDVPLDFDMFARSYMLEWLYDVMHKGQENYPISYYGDRSYLPPDISGSYGNATIPSPYSGVAMMLEDDGTLVMLRPGTDGADRDVYYAYVNNATAGGMTLPNWTVTSQPYRPGFIPAGSKVFAILHGNRDVIVGIVSNLNNQRTGYFIALTHGTFDQSKHTGVIIPNGNFLNITYTESTQEIGLGAFVLQQKVYILLSTYNGKNGYARNTSGWLVYTLPLDDVDKGRLVAATRVTGWTINRGSGGQVSRNDLIIADNIQAVCTINSNVVFTDYPEPNSTEGFWSVPKVEGSTQRINYCHNVTFQSRVNANYGNAAFVFSFDFDPVNKIIDVSALYNSKTNVVASPNVSIGNSAAVNNNGARALLGGRKQVYVYSDVDGHNFIFTNNIDSNQDARYSYANYTGMAIDVKAGMTTTPKNLLGFSGLAKPGGPLGTNFHSIQCLSDTEMTVFTLTKRTQASDPEWAYVRCRLEGTPTYEHRSATGKYGRPGFPPTDNRNFINGPGTVAASWAQSYAGTLAEAFAGTFNVSGAVFHVFDDAPGYWGSMLGRPKSIYPGGSTSGFVSCSDALAWHVKQLVLEEFKLQGYTHYIPSNGDPVMCTLYIPQVSWVPPFVHGCYITSDRRAIWYIYALLVPEGRSLSNLGSTDGVRLRIVREQVRIDARYEKNRFAYERSLDFYRENLSPKNIYPVPPPPPTFEEKGPTAYEYYQALRQMRYAFLLRQGAGEVIPEEHQIPDPEEEYLAFKYPYGWKPSAMTFEQGGFNWVCAKYLHYWNSQNAIRFVQGHFLLVLSTNGFLQNDGGSSSFITSVRFNTETHEWMYYENLPYQPTGSPIAPVNFPGRGLYLAMSSEVQYGNVDFSTKLIGKEWANDNSWPGESLLQAVQSIQNGGVGQVLLSQQVPSAWTLFINQPQKAMLRNVEWTLPVFRHTFNAGTDQNKTFNLWMRSNSMAGAATYQVLEQSQMPMGLDPNYIAHFMHLGKITTNNLGIVNIDVRKPVQIGHHILSPDQRGSSIPTSGGTPSVPTPLSWS